MSALDRWAVLGAITPIPRETPKGSAEKWFFTTYERDSESGNDYAIARYHVSRLGRLSSPDPIGSSTSNPQSLNRYAYSINDPANVADPSGLCAVMQLQPLDDSQQASAHGGPNADDANLDTGTSNGGAQSGTTCYDDPWDSDLPQIFAHGIIRRSPC